LLFFGNFKRYFVHKLIGAEQLALHEKLDRIVAVVEKLDSIEALQQATGARLELVASAILASPPSSALNDVSIAGLASALRRVRAEQDLATQIARVTDLDMTQPARSVIFLHNSYYHFFYLARALRKRGWRAISVSLEDPNGINAQYYHGEDVNIHDSDPDQLRANAEALFNFAKRHFNLMHFAGQGHMSFFPANFSTDDPADIVEWKKLGKKVAYTISGCKDSTAQSSVHRWAISSTGKSLCDNCVWQDNPLVCSDADNLAWGKRLHKYCDAIFSEMLPSLDYLSSTHAKVVRSPHTMANDEDFWRPDLVIPDAYRLAREVGEVLVYHAVGNYDFRSAGGRNIKGTPAVVQAIDRLKSEGVRVRLVFFTKVPNTEVRYFQAQCDIVVDQLWAGSYGATAREAMLLGKPVVGFINPFEFDPRDSLEVLQTVPIVNAAVDTIYDVLKDLVLNADKRRDIGEKSRAFAVKWHGARASAAAYESAYDDMLARSRSVEQP